MGRIKTSLQKRVTNEFINVYGDEVTDNFTVNKGLVNKYVSVPSKKFRNIIAGYITRIVRKSKEGG